MSKKNKFDLTTLVKMGYLKEGETLYFVSDPQKTCIIEKVQSGEFKVRCGKESQTIHSLSQAWLGQEPPGHASKWLRANSGKTLYDLWQLTLQHKNAA